MNQRIGCHRMYVSDHFGFIAPTNPMRFFITEQEGCEHSQKTGPSLYATWPRSPTSFCLGWKEWARRIRHSGSTTFESGAGAGRRSFIPIRRPANSTAWDSRRGPTHYGEAGAARPSSAEIPFLHDAAPERARRSSPGSGLRRVPRSDRSDDLHCRITLNSSNRRNLPFPFLAHNPLDLYDRAAVPAIESRIVRRSLPIQPPNFRPSCFIAQPGSFLPLQFP